MLPFKSIITSFLLITLVLITNAIGQHLQNVTGTVIDIKSGDPLQGVNVFLANTMKGDATDAAGNFNIKNVPTGQFEIVVSMIGYDVYSRLIRVTIPMGKTFLFKLRPRVLQGETIIVNADEQKEWRKNLKIFEKRLLGTTENASKTKIENPFIIDLKNNERGELAASATEPLIIINKGLGYKIEYILRYFSAKGRHTKYAGNPKFTSLKPESDKQEQQWRKRRKKAYQGSTRHFFTELISAAKRIQALRGPELEKQYKKYKIKKNRNKNPRHTLQMLLTRDYLKKAGFQISFPNDSKTTSVDFRAKDMPVNSALLFSPSANDDELWLKLNRPLNIRFNREREDPTYLEDTDIIHRWTGPQGSIIEIEADSVLVEKKGRYWDNFQLHTHGYMAWERLAESLPYEYEPDEVN
ncbi:MAG: carboxypeptidase-like regulatory domain-containing protein [Calditrichaeota bacterium]|nr:MAG: carboxypeptidase-like regulatory domain-containing protein [Calditrichota bacterium]